MANTYHPRGVLVHGYKVREHPLYMIWADMKSRCDDQNTKEYVNYGGRGITYCDRWKDFRNFAEDMWPKPLGLTLERKDNDKGYSPDNCVWATTSQQAKNRRVFKNSSSGITGVIPQENGSYNARYNSDGKRYDLGYFDTIEQAAAARTRFVELFEGGRVDEAMALLHRGRVTRHERRLSRDSTTGVKGVAQHPSGGFVVRARTVNGERKYLGYAATMEKAISMLEIYNDQR